MPTHAPEASADYITLHGTHTSVVFPHLSVYDNMAFGMQLAGVAAGTIRQKVNEAARVLQLEALLDRKPKALSGGQRQRVAIGRAIVREPGVFLFDEPLSNLDAALRVQTRFEIAKIHRDFGKASTIYVTHDQVEAMTLADKMVVLRAGRIEQVGHPLDLYANPCNEFVAGFVGAPAMNMLAGQYRAEGANAAITLDGGALLDCALAAQGAAAGGACKAGVRPEHWQIGGDGLLLATVTVVERLGASSYIHAVCGQHTLCVETRAAHAPLAGDSISLTPLPGMVYLFDDAGRTISAPKAAGTR